MKAEIAKHFGIVLSQVPKLLQKLDFESAPSLIQVNFNAARVVYLKQYDGYCGVVYDMETGRRYGLAHYVSLVGKNAGWITPTAVTHLLAQDKFSERKLNDREDYNNVLKRALEAIILAMLEPADEEEEVSIKDYLVLPDFYEFSRGEMSEEDLVEAEKAGAEDYLLEFCSRTGHRLTINVEALLLSRVNKDYIGVEAGEWGDESTRHARHIFLPRSIVQLAKKKGLRLFSVKQMLPA